MSRYYQGKTGDLLSHKYILGTIIEQGNLIDFKQVIRGMPQRHVKENKKIQKALEDLSDEKYLEKTGNGYTVTEKGLDLLRDLESFWWKEYQQKESITGNMCLLALEDKLRDGELDTLSLTIQVTDPLLINELGFNDEGVEDKEEENLEDVAQETMKYFLSKTNKSREG